MVHVYISTRMYDCHRRISFRNFSHCRLSRCDVSEKMGIVCRREVEKLETE